MPTTRVWSNSTFKSALNDSRLDQAKDEIVDELYSRYVTQNYLFSSTYSLYLPNVFNVSYLSSFLFQMTLEKHARPTQRLLCPPLGSGAIQPLDQLLMDPDRIKQKMKLSMNSILVM